MISSLTGKIADISGVTVIIDVHGVGYELHCTHSLISRLSVGKDASIIVFTDIKEDSIRLFGFNDVLEKQVFGLLMLVKGIGAKTGCEVVSAVDKKELLRAIGNGDLAKLQGVKGVGKKTAERIVVELRDKVGEIITDLHTSQVEIIRSKASPIQDAIDALQALGFSRNDAESAVGQVERSGVIASKALEAGEIVKEALKFV